MHPNHPLEVTQVRLLVADHHHRLTEIPVDRSERGREPWWRAGEVTSARAIAIRCSPGLASSSTQGATIRIFFIFLPNYEMILPDGFNRALSFKDF
jgi:hypothetical protein